MLIGREFSTSSLTCIVDMILMNRRRQRLRSQALRGCIFGLEFIVILFSFHWYREDSDTPSLQFTFGVGPDWRSSLYERHHTFLYVISRRQFDTLGTIVHIVDSARWSSV